MLIQRWFMTFLVVVATSASTWADIYRWDNGELIPGTMGITPGPGVMLDHRELSYAELFEQDLTDSRFDFSNLTSADLTNSRLTNADLSGANLTNANMLGTFVSSAAFNSNTVFNQWTAFPRSFDPIAAGLTRVTSPAGDLDGSDALDAIDVDVLTTKIRTNEAQPSWLPNAAFDLNGDSLIDLDDHRVWVQDLRHTWFGDANLDGEFNSADLVIAFADGGYEQGPRAVVSAVPESAGAQLLSMGLLGLGLYRRASCRP